MPEALLEFKAEDEAWYAGTAEFEGPSLRVHFEDFPVEEDEIWPLERFKSPEDVRRLVRRASQSMQDSQCSSLRRGMLLCVACRRMDTDCFEYYDAKLQQCLRSPHNLLEDGQEECKCKFEVEWLFGPFRQERQFVVCGDICLRKYGNIEEDPIIKEYIMKIKSFRGLKDLSSLDTPNGHTGLIPNKRQSMALDDKTRHIEEPPLKRPDLNTPPRNRILEPSLSCSLSNVNGAAEVPLDVIQIDSDKEEEPGTLKNALPAKTTEVLSHSELKEEKTVNDKQSEATSPSPKKTIRSRIVDEFSTHDFSGVSKEHTFTCGGSVAACSCVAMHKHHFRSKSCNCEAVGFIPISPCQLTSICSHRKSSYRSCKLSSRQARRSGRVCGFLPSSQGCCKVDYSQACKTTQSQVFEEGGDTVEDIRDKDMKGLFHYLLAENLETDISPSKALEAVQKVSSGAITVYIWPSLEYETVRRGYIFYQDFKAAEAAHGSFSAGKFVVMSSKGRPWVVSRACRHKLDWMQLYNIMPAGVIKEERDEAGKELGQDDLLIVHKGTEEYTVAVGKQKLFMMQQVKLQQCYERFHAEEEEYTAAVCKQTFFTEQKENLQQRYEKFRV